MNVTKRRTIKFLERKEVEQIITKIKTKGARNLRDRALIEVLFSTGMRISECLSLKLGDIAVMLKEGKREQAIIGKGGWQRIVFFSPRALKALESYVLTIGNSEQEALFPITSRAAQLMVERRGIKAGISKKVTPHMFRHSLATDLLRQGVDIRFVSEFLGHRSLNNTMVYTHVVNEQLNEIHRKIYL